jgi:hypothetical protein
MHTKYELELLFFVDPIVGGVYHSILTKIRQAKQLCDE